MDDNFKFRGESEAVNPVDHLAVLIDWTPELIKQAEFEAELGSLKLAGDLVEFCLTDSRAITATNKRVGTLLALPTVWEGESKAVIKTLEKRGDWYRIAPECELRQILTWGIHLGVGLGELVWTTVKYRKVTRVVPRLKAHNPKFLRWVHARQTWQLRVATGPQLQSTEWIDITPGDGRWVVYTPYGGARPWMFGLWRAISKGLLLKALAQGYWGQFNKRHGNATTLAEFPEALQHDEKGRAVLKQFAAEVKKIGPNGMLFHPTGTKLSMLEPQNGAYKTFPDLIQLVDHDTTIAILSNNLTTDAAAGTGNSASVHADGLWDTIRYDDETLSTTTHDQILVPYTVANYGDQELAPWATHETETATKKAQTAQRVQMLSQGGSALIANYTIHRSELRELIGLDPDNLPEQPNAPAKPDPPQVGVEPTSSDGSPQ